MSYKNSTKGEEEWFFLQFIPKIVSRNIYDEYI